MRTFIHRGETYDVAAMKTIVHKYERQPDLVCKGEHIVDMIEGFEAAIIKRPEQKSQIECRLRSLRMELDKFVAGVAPIEVH